ncbi:ABC transporter permease [Streptomyces mirabilis]|uniref:ABC transporter permease n=1 Tax=Streptomyces mirabilis TaxID=68239 RepID=UPI00369D2B11
MQDLPKAFTRTDLLDGQRHTPFHFKQDIFAPEEQGASNLYAHTDDSGDLRAGDASCSWAGVAASAALVALTVAVAWHGRLRLALDITLAAVRAALQLAAVGALLLLVFRHTGLAGAIGWLALMVLIADQVAARRAAALPKALLTPTVAIVSSTAATMGTLLALGVIAPQTRVVIPVGGMVVSGAMQATALALTRLYDEIRTAHTAIRGPPRPRGSRGGFPLRAQPR